MKQRVVVLAPSGAQRIEADAAILAIGGGAQVREVFAARFPLERFFNVVASMPGKPGWETAPSISIDDLGGWLDQSAATGATAPKGPGDDGENPAPDPAQEAKFLRYSASCADYLAVPSVMSHEVAWEEVEIKSKKGATRKVRS